MKTMKLKAASVAMLLTLFAVNASAQPQQGRAHRGVQKPSAEKIAEVMTDKMDQRLELTDAQEKKIYAINLKYAQLRAENKPERPAKTAKGDKPTPEERKAMGEALKVKMNEVKAERKAQMVETMKVLTDEQSVDYALMLASAKQHNCRHKAAPHKKAPQQKREPRQKEKMPKKK